MLQTIEVQIDNYGIVHPVEPQIKLPVGRALLTLLDNTVNQAETSNIENPFDNLFGIIKTDKTASLEDMKQAIYQRAMERFNDSD